MGSASRKVASDSPSIPPKTVELPRVVNCGEVEVILNNAPHYTAIFTEALRNAFWHGLSDADCKLEEDRTGLLILTQLERCTRRMTKSPGFSMKAAFKIMEKDARPDVKAAIEQNGPSLVWPEKTIEKLHKELVGVTADGAPIMLFPQFLDQVSENLACIIKSIDLPIFLDRSVTSHEWKKLLKGVGKFTVGAVATGGSIALAVLSFVSVVGSGYAPFSLAPIGVAGYAAAEGAVEVGKLAKGCVQGVYYAATSTEHAFDLYHEGKEVLKEERHLALSILKALQFCDAQLAEQSKTQWGDLNIREKKSRVDKILNKCNRSGGTAHSMTDVMSMDLDDWVALDLLRDTDYFKQAKPEVRELASLAMMAGFCMAELHGRREHRKKTVVVAGFGNAGKSTLVQALTGRQVPDKGDRVRTKVPRSYCVKGSDSVRLIDTPAIDDHDENVAKTTFHLIGSQIEVKNAHIMFLVPFDRVSNLVNSMADCFTRACAMPGQSGDKLKVTVLLHKFQSHREATADDAIQVLHQTKNDWEENIKKRIDRNIDRIELKVLTSDVLQHSNLRPELREHVADLAKIRELIRS